MKSIALCLEELAILIDRDGANGVNEKLFKQLFKYVEHSDSGARRATSTLIEKIYENQVLSEEHIMKLLGKVSQNTKLSLKEKIDKISLKPKK